MWIFIWTERIRIFPVSGFFIDADFGVFKILFV